jgi:hypothetical protein
VVEGINKFPPDESTVDETTMNFSLPLSVGCENLKLGVRNSCEASFDPKISFIRIHRPSRDIL